MITNLHKEIRNELNSDEVAVLKSLLKVNILKMEKKIKEPSTENELFMNKYYLELYKSMSKKLISDELEY